MDKYVTSCFYKGFDKSLHMRYDLYVNRKTKTHKT